MRSFLHRPKSWRRVIGIGFAAAGIFFWVAGANASEDSSPRRAAFDITVGGAMTVCGIVVIATADRRFGRWYDRD
jgi:drug/metabolite transporter (DMT)-like permease